MILRTQSLKTQPFQWLLLQEYIKTYKNEGNFVGLTMRMTLDINFLVDKISTTNVEPKEV